METKLRKEWENSEPCKRVREIEGSAILTGRASNYEGITISDWWLSKLSSILAEKKAAIEKLPTALYLGVNGEMEMYYKRDDIIRIIESE